MTISFKREITVVSVNTDAAKVHLRCLNLKLKSSVMLGITKSIFITESFYFLSGMKMNSENISCIANPLCWT